MMPQPPTATYDDLPYPSYPFPQTHPDHLAVLATLSGLAFGLSAGVVTASEASDVLEDTLRVWFGSLDAGAAEG